MKRLISILCLAVIGCHPLAHSGELPTEQEFSQEASNTVSEVYAICAAYFGIVSNAVAESGKAELGQKYTETMIKAVERAITAAANGRTAEMAEKVTMARFQMHTKSMLEEIEGNASNISILMTKHMDYCIHAMNNPSEIVREVSGKLLDKYQPAPLIQ